METIKISLNKPIYETEELDINWNLCSENNGILTIVLNNNAGYSINVGDFIRFERFVTIENENPFGVNVPEGFEYSHVASVAYDNCEVLTKSGYTAFTVTAPKRELIYINPNSSAVDDNKATIVFKTSHDFFYQDIDFAIANNNPIKLYQADNDIMYFTFSATTNSGNFDGVPSTYIKPQQAECGEDEIVEYDYYFLPTRESRFNVKTASNNVNWLTYQSSGDTLFYENIGLACNQNVFYFVGTNNKVKVWNDYHGQTKTTVSKYVGYWNISVPLEANNDYAHLNQESRINESYSDKIKSSVIPDFINMERVKYKPVSSGETIELISGITFNLHFRERIDNDWHIRKDGGWNCPNDFDKSDGLYYLNFTDNDVRYQKMKVQKSFLRLSFYRSDSNEDNEFNPLNASLLYYSTIFLDSGELYGKFNSKRTELLENGRSWDEEEMPNYVLSASVSNNSTIRVDTQITVLNEFNTTKSSEGFNIYLFADDTPENAPETIYMKVEFNHAGFGRTIPMAITNNGIDMDNYYNYLYIPLHIAHVNGKYIYAFDDIESEYQGNYYIKTDANKRSITFNLFEPKILA